VAYNEDLAQRLRQALKKQRGLQEKKMFGGVGFLINGNMACGVHKEDLIVRLSSDDFEAALKIPNARVFNMTGRPMKGWIMVAAAGYATDKSLRSWIEKSVGFARSLPQK
jgi:TfoX/Sxy family transcriptional regulator of competence genes